MTIACESSDSTQALAQEKLIPSWPTSRGRPWRGSPQRSHPDANRSDSGSCWANVDRTRRRRARPATKHARSAGRAYRRAAARSDAVRDS